MLQYFLRVETLGPFEDHQMIYFLERFYYINNYFIYLFAIEQSILNGHIFKVNKGVIKISTV